MSQALDQNGYPPARVGWRIVGILFLAFTMSGIDSYVLNVLIDPIRKDLRVSDVQISLLQGFAGAVFGLVFAVLFGFGIDRISRKWLLFGGVVGWSLASILGGLAPSFGWLFASKALMAGAVSGVMPACLSLISDVFPPERRSLPISVYLAGSNAGPALAVALAGWAEDHAPAMLAQFGVPISHQPSAWRIVFILSGLLSASMLVLFAAFREPRRIGAAKGKPVHASVADTAAFFVNRLGFFAPFYMGLVLVNIGSFGTRSWEVALLTRHFGLSASQAGQSLGPALLIVGLIGYGFAGAFVQRMARRDPSSAYLKILIGASLCLIPSALAGLAPTAALAIVALSSFSFFGPIVYVAVNCTLAEMAPNAVRGMSSAIISVLNTVIAQTVGPLVVALCTQYLFKAPSMLGYSIMLVGAPAFVAAAGLYLLAFLALKGVKLVHPAGHALADATVFSPVLAPGGLTDG
jgi:MFS family permease